MTHGVGEKHPETTSISAVSRSCRGPSSCLGEAFNGSSSWPSTDANPTEWQSLSNRVFFPPPSLFYSTEQILIQSRFKSSTAETGTQFPWHYCPLLSALVLEWHWTHHQTVLSACLILSGLKTSTSVVDKSHDMQEEVDNEAITVLFFFIHYYWEGFIFFHVILH